MIAQGRCYITARYNAPGNVKAEVGIQMPIWDAMSSPTVPDICSPKAINEALGGFLNQISSLNSPLKGGVVLGELRKTLGTIARPFVASYKLLKAYKRQAERITIALLRKLKRDRKKGVSKRGLREAHKKLASLWLEYSFGIMPLVNDVGNAIVAYQKWCGQAVAVAPIWSSGSDESLVSTDTFTKTPAFNISTIGVKTVKLQSKCRFGGEYGHRVDQQGNVDGALRACGFQLSEFVPTIWELLPFSWLADYFANVGTIITSTFTSTANVLWHYRTTKATRTQEWTARCNWAKCGPLIGPGATLVLDQQGDMVMETTSFTRSVPQLGVPGLVFKIPGLTTQWANMLAVLTSIRK